MTGTVSPASRRAARLVEFNLHVARFAHVSWCQDALPIKASERTEPQVSAWLLEASGLQGMLDWEMEEPGKRIWLLDQPEVERLSVELALCMHREWLLQVIDAAHWRALRAHLDPELLRFVVEDVPAGSFHYQSPMVRFDSGFSPQAMRELREQGARTLMGLLTPAWRAVRGRARLFFDRALALEEVPLLDTGLHLRAVELILQTVIPRRFAQWGWCF